MTSELLGEEGLAIDGDFERLMDEQRARGRASARGANAETGHERAAAGAFAGEATVQTRFTGYETELQQTTVAALQSIAANGASGEAASRPEALGEVAGSGEAGGDRYLVKLAESPFYAAGGGQVSDVGTIECEHGDCLARVEECFSAGRRSGARGSGRAGLAAAREPVLARVDHARDTPPSATTPPRTCFTPRCASAWETTCARPAPTSDPDKLRFDFSHGQALERAGAARCRGSRERVDRTQRPRPSDHDYS